jgi:hypothetical protein
MSASSSFVLELDYTSECCSFVDKLICLQSKNTFVYMLNYCNYCQENEYSYPENVWLQCEKYKDTLACLMITYPSTNGVFDKEVR